MTLGYHIRIRLANDGVIASTPAERRILARVVLAQGQGCHLVAFGLADNHLHIVVCVDSRRAAEMARRIELSLRRRLGLEASFQPAYLKPIEDGHHLYSAFDYVLRQDQRHQLGCDPCREATNLPDLLGLRLIGATTRADVRRFLPRVRRADLLRSLGVPEVVPADDPLAHLREATLSAATISDLKTPTREVMIARCAAITVAGSRVTSGELAEQLGVPARTVRRAAHRGADAELVVAIRRQLHLRGQIESRLSEAALPSQAKPPARPHRLCRMDDHPFLCNARR